MRLQARTVLLVFALFIVACEGAPDVSNSEVFSKHGVTFSHPGNWTIKHANVDADGSREIEVHSVSMFGIEGDHSVMINVLDEPSNLDSFVSIVSSSLGAELGDITTVGETQWAETGVGEPRSIKSHFAGKPTRGVVLPYHITVFDERVDMTMEFHELKTEHGYAIVSAITPTEDLVSVRPGFQMIYDTFELTGKATQR